MINMINWKIRIKNKMFWLASVPAVLLLIEQIAALFGYSISTELIGTQLANIIETVFTLLAIMGIVADPTTKGFEDSERAKGYTELK